MGEEPRLSALLWSLVSPRDQAKSPYRSAARCREASGEHWGVWMHHVELAHFHTATLQSREGDGRLDETDERSSPSLRVDSGEWVVAGKGISLVPCYLLPATSAMM